MNKTIYFIFSLFIAPLFLLTSCNTKQDDPLADGQHVLGEVWGDSCFYTLKNGVLDGEIIFKYSLRGEIRGQYENGLKKGEWKYEDVRIFIFDEQPGEEWRNSDVRKLFEQFDPNYFYDEDYYERECVGNYFCKSLSDSYYYEGYYKEGKKDGEWILTDQDGKKKKVYYRYDSERNVMFDSVNTVISSIKGDNDLEDVEKFLQDYCKEEIMEKPNYVKNIVGESSFYHVYDFKSEYKRNGKRVFTETSHDDEGIFVKSYKTYYDLNGNKRRELSEIYDEGYKTVTDLYFDENERVSNKVVYTKSDDEVRSIEITQFNDSVLIDNEYVFADSIVGLCSNDTLEVRYFAESRSDVYRYSMKVKVVSMDTIPDILTCLLNTHNDTVKKYIDFSVLYPVEDDSDDSTEDD